MLSEAFVSDLYIHGGCSSTEDEWDIQPTLNRAALNFEKTSGVRRLSLDFVCVCVLNSSNPIQYSTHKYTGVEIIGN